MHYYDAMGYGCDFDTTRLLKDSIPEVDYKLAMWCKNNIKTTLYTNLKIVVDKDSISL